jgi:hypothetical protein
MSATLATSISKNVCARRQVAFGRAGVQKPQLRPGEFACFAEAETTTAAGTDSTVLRTNRQYAKHHTCSEGFWIDAYLIKLLHWHQLR